MKGIDNDFEIQCQQHALRVAMGVEGNHGRRPDRGRAAG
jgi:hypothetical protein